MMGRNEQSQGQELNVAAATKKEKVNCYWFKPKIEATGDLEMFQELDPMILKKVDIVLYQGKTSKVFCPYIVKGKCTSPLKERDECYLLDE